MRIRNLLPRVNIDPLQILRSAFLKWLPPGGKPTFQLKSVTVPEVAKMVSKLKNSQSYGRDKIDAKTLKLACLFIAPVIAHAINLSLGTSYFPPKWKLARIIPILKAKGLDRNSPASFRPICQLPILSKLAERVVQRQLLLYLEESSQLHENHHAYRNRCSTVTALTQLMDQVAVAADLNTITTSINLDLSATFDCVSHVILKEKLKFYGLDKPTQDWLSSYLDNRSGFIVIGSASSSIRNSPQGSVLGPLLYLMYVNELPSLMKLDNCSNAIHEDSSKLFTSDCSLCGSFTMYADDGQFQFASKYRGRNQMMLESTFCKVKDFLNANELIVNEAKTTLMEMMTYQKRAKISGIPPDLTVQEHIKDRDGAERLIDKHVTDATWIRMLGLNMQNNMTWDAHLSAGSKALLPAVRRQLGMLALLGDNISRKGRLQLVNCLILSRLAYGISLWGQTTENHSRKAQVVQNIAARMVTRSGRRTRQADLIADCGWLNISELTQYYSLLQMWKTVWWDTPQYMGRLIEIDDDNLLTTCKPRLQQTANTYRWKTVHHWNQMSDTLRLEPRIGKFKKMLKQWLILKRITDLSQDDRPP